MQRYVRDANKVISPTGPNGRLGGQERWCGGGGKGGEGKGEDWGGQSETFITVIH